jgi:tetratricopeptide (TPR) repeat protein
MTTRRLHIALLALIAAGSSTLRAGAIDWGEVHALTLRGIDRLYDMNIDGAAATFDSVRRMAPGDPRGYFFGSMVHFWLYTLTRDEKEYREFLDSSDVAIAVCERLLDANDRDATALFYLGGIYGYRGLAHQAHNSIFKAVSEGRKGYMSLRDAVQLKPDLYDAQMGFGLFTYLVAKVPRSLSWVLSLVGFSGDAEKGIAMVRVAAERGTYTRTEARFYLAQFLFGEQRSDEALAIMDTLMRAYPHNALFVLTDAAWQSRLAALQAALRAVAINEHNRVHYGQEFIPSTLGAIYYALDDFGRARSYLEAYIATVPTQDYVTNWTRYRLAVAQELCGDRAAALRTYASIRKSGDGAGESMMYRIAQRRLREPMTGADALLVCGGNALARKAYDSAAAYFGAALRAGESDPDTRALALNGLQQVELGREEYASAVRTGEELVALSPARETWTIPQGYLQTGIAYARLGKQAEARASLEKALQFDDYDYRKNIEEKIRKELEKLNPPG